MKVFIFGATGMVGASALREALNASEVETVLSIGRHPSGVVHPKLVRFLPFLVTTSELLGRAMLRVVEGRADRFILESADINKVGA